MSAIALQIKIYPNMGFLIGCMGNKQKNYGLSVGALFQQRNEETNLYYAGSLSWQRMDPLPSIHSYQH
jgi:hypothetical protein